MAQGGSNKKVANSLVAMSSAAVLAVYAAGYTRTRSAAQQLETQSVERRPANPAPLRAATLPVPATAAALSEPATHETAAAEPTEPAVTKQAALAAPVESKASALVDPAAPAVVAVPEPTTLPAEKAEEQKAELPTVAPPAPVPPAAPIYKDGTYLGWGTSRHGDIQASVVIEGGRIASATIAQCWTRYSCSVIAQLPPQVAQRQSPEVDFVSGATQSANAFYYGVVDALSKAK